MLYKVDDSRWLRLTWAGGIWTGPDLSKQPADVARVIRRWENDMEELEKSEFDDTVLSGIQHRVALDFFKNTVVRYIDPAAEMNLWTMEHNREEWSDAKATQIARERIVMLATLYAKCVKEYGRRYTETGFTTMLRGAPMYDVEDVGAPDKATQEAEWLDMLSGHQNPLLSPYLRCTQGDVARVCLDSTADQSVCDGVPGAACTETTENSGPWCHEFTFQHEYFGDGCAQSKLAESHWTQSNYIVNAGPISMGGWGHCRRTARKCNHRSRNVQ